VDYGQVVARLRAAGCVFAEDEATLLIAEADDLDRAVAERVTGRPLEYILGWAEFCDRSFAVTDGVFVPRAKSALLVDVAAELLPRGGTVLDVCCGSGALGAALADRVPHVRLHAADIDPHATDCARVNLVGRGTVHTGDLFAPFPVSLRGRVDLILANVPYVPTGEIAHMPSEARDHEARAALDGGADGGAVLRRVAAEAPQWLRPGGGLIVESSESQAELFSAVMRQSRLTPAVRSDPELGATVVIGTRH
jgi:release factor glutamine methyltransferase